MVEMDYRTTEEKNKDEVIEDTLRFLKRVMEGRDLEDVKIIQTQIKQYLLALR